LTGRKTGPKTGKVYIVGAGPGDPALITVRAVELLSRADVVAYDRLSNPALLELAPQAELVDVGKRPGESAAGQERINELIVSEARKGRIVVRLKGGDPFVFGRGGEEAEVLADAGIPFEIVPGITAAVAGPAYAGIPLTHRAHASWVAIATGHEDPTKPESSLDWDALARAPSAVFFMGVERLEGVTEALLAAGRSADTPAAVVASATWPHQRVVRSTLEKIVDAVRTAEVSPPALLVVGDVVALGERLDWIGQRPLNGMRVFVTRTRAQAGKLSALLRDAGAVPLEFPAIKIAPPSSYEGLDEALGSLERFEWVVFTSPNAVDAVWARLEGRDARAFAANKVAAVGPATADALRQRGIEADFVPSTFTSAALAREFPAAEGEILVPQAEDAPDDLLRASDAAGRAVHIAPAYRTVTDDASVSAGRQALAEGVDAVLFTSGSTVRSFVELWGPPPPDCIVCCIGPRTAEVAAELGVMVGAVAEEHTLDGLVSALIGAVRG
jgi:uroporphyrinogen III methyltransferase / synthase